MELTQIQQQKLEQQQLLKLTQQQMLSLHLLEIPIANLEEEIRAAMDDNPALEKDFSYETAYENENDNENYSENSENSCYNNEDENEGGDVPDSPLSGSEGESISDYENDEDYAFPTSSDSTQGWEQSDTASFYDLLMEQMRELTLTDSDRSIMEYLIGSLDGDGLLRKQIDVIIDELAIYYYIDTTEEDILRLLRMLQEFDPAGIGAQSLQECLLLQIERMPESDLTRLMQRVISSFYDEFMKKHWNRIQAELKIPEETMQDVVSALRRLNPKPGASLNESASDTTAQITPDIIIEKDDEGNVTFSINHGNLPELKISDDYLEELRSYDRKDGSALSRSEQEAKAYYKEKVEKANWYIESIKMRYRTMTLCTRAIMQWQKRYFVDGDESELRPMILRDIAEKTGLDVSTVSRFSNQKYADTPWGIRPMRFFFSDGYTNEDGEEMATRKIKLKLKEIIDSEDKRKPLSDEALTKAMNAAGFSVARRTISKYREKMGIPVARLRK